MIVQNFSIQMMIQIFHKQMDADFALCTNRSPNMDLEWMLYHGGNWLCIMRPCAYGIGEHLKRCFVRKNNLPSVVTQMVTCLSQASVLCFLGQERNFPWNNRYIAKVFELTTYCIFTDVKLRIFFFQSSLYFANRSEMIVL